MMFFEYCKLIFVSGMELDDLFLKAIILTEAYDLEGNAHES